MWLEKEFPYYEIKFDCDSHEDTEYNEVILNEINEWQQMREKRENDEITTDEYDLAKIIQVTPSADFNNLNYVNEKILIFNFSKCSFCFESFEFSFPCHEEL